MIKLFVKETSIGSNDLEAKLKCHGKDDSDILTQVIDKVLSTSFTPSFVDPKYFRVSG